MNEERELKFRVYTHVSKSFIYFDIYGYPSGIAFGVSAPQQFTGFKDSEGKEIYEGDILDYGMYKWGPVIFDEGTFSAVCHNMHHKTYTFAELFYDEKFIRNVKVIGNIIEHKHLLN